MIDQQGVSVVCFCFIGKIMCIKVFFFQCYEQVFWCYFLCVGNDCIECEICFVVFGVKDIGNFVECYVNYVIIFSKCVVVMWFE